jgi:hypothetical protein
MQCCDWWASGRQAASTVKARGAIEERARVLLSAWSGASDAAARLNLFNTGFGADPCLAARLNGIAEFRAGQLGISEQALVGARADPALAMKIYELSVEKEKEFNPGDEYDWIGFKAFLAEARPEIVADPNFDASYADAKLAWDV